MRADDNPGAATAVSLRSFQQADLAVAFALDQVCFAEGIAYTRAELRYFVLRPTAYAVVAEKAGQMAGFLVASHSVRQKNGAAHIVTLDVDPRARRLGIASLLMDDAEQHYMAIGRAALQLEVAVDNEPALHFYRKRGFAEQGFLPGYYNGVLDAVVMKKLLPIVDRS